MPLFSKPRREHDKTLTYFSDFQFWGQDQACELWKDKQADNPKPRLIKNQNWSETRQRVSVPLVAKPSGDRESRRSVFRSNSYHQDLFLQARR